MDLTILAPIGAVLALLFAVFQAKKVMKEDEGTDLMKSLSQKIRTGADAHVVMFLGWTDDGRIRCVHETSGSINNVTVGTRIAGWPY